eukprot:6186289-Pleurochrysis_carterae.AAC.1
MLQEAESHAGQRSRCRCGGGCLFQLHRLAFIWEHQHHAWLEWKQQVLADGMLAVIACSSPGSASSTSGGNVVALKGCLRIICPPMRLLLVARGGEGSQASPSSFGPDCGWGLLEVMGDSSGTKRTSDGSMTRLSESCA